MNAPVPPFIAPTSTTLDGTQTVRVLCACGERVDSDAAEWGRIPTTTCPACGRRWTVSVCVDEVEAPDAGGEGTP